MSKNILLTYLIKENFRTRRITHLTTEYYFTSDVNQFAAKLKEGQVLFAVDTYSFEAEPKTARDLWRSLTLNLDLTWDKKILAMLDTYPNGLRQSLSV